MKLALSIRLSSGSTVIHDAREIPDSPGGWTLACRRAPSLGKKAIALLEALHITSVRGWGIRKVSRQPLWKAYRKGIWSKMVMIRLID